MNTITDAQLIDLIYRETELIDALQLQDWEALFTDDGHYWMPLTHGQTDPILQGSLMYEDKMLLKIRVERFFGKRTFSQQPQSVRDRLRILHETRRVAPHPVMAHPRVPAADRDKMRQAFLELAASAEGRALLAAIPMPAPVAAHASDYRELTDLGLERYYVKGGD